jgi:Bacterial Ig domain
MRGTRIVAVAAACLGAVVAPAGAQAAESGVNIAINQTVDGPSASQALRVGWVRQFVGWSAAEPERGRLDQGYLARLRADVAAYRARGIRTLFVVSSTPAWAAGPRGAGLAGPRDPEDYARFVGELARLVPDVEAIEIWNEADEGTFWAGGPEPGAYAALLRASYAAIKAQDPGITVVSTGMVANNYEFLSDMYDAGAGGSFDAVGVHTDTACLLTSPADYYREPNGRVGRYSFTGYRELHDLMTARGDGGKGIWMTEIGWNTGSRKPRSCRDGAVARTRAEGVSERTQARFLTLAYRCLAADPYVRVAMWFSLQDVGRGAGYGDHLGLIRTSGARKPAARAMRAVRNGAGVEPARCGGRSDRVGPSLDVRAPVDGGVFTSSENLPVRVRARDAPGGTGMRRVELYVDGRRVRVWGGGSVSSSWFGFRTLGFGTHSVVVRAVDRAANRTERALTISKVTPASFDDRAGPRVRWRSVPRRAGGSVRIGVHVSDRGAGLRKATLHLDGRRLRTRRADGLWRPRISLHGVARGRHRLTLRAEDRAGNVTRSRRPLVRR